MRTTIGTGVAFLSATLALVVVALWHLTQGTSGVGATDLLGVFTGDGAARDVLTGSRLPRMLAGVAVGIALGAAGALFQSLACNSLASPDTLAVNAGAYLAIVAATAAGVSLPLHGEALLAFASAIGAAAVVLFLAGGGTSTTRLILAGSALAMTLSAATAALLLLFEQETTGLFAWGSGTLTQFGLRSVTQMAPVILVCLVAAWLLAPRLDLMALGDDTARVLGVPVPLTRIIGTCIAVLLAAAAVTLAGPIGFVGLCAPAAVRLIAHIVPGVMRHRVLVPLSALTGALIVLVADATVRQILGADDALGIPTGVTTTLVGAVLLIVLARRATDSGPARQPPAAHGVTAHTPRRFVVVLLVLAAAAVGCLTLGLMSGYTFLLPGDLLVWARGDAIAIVEFAMSERAPRVAAAILAGAALALSGAVVQAVARNPLAEPGLLGITGGAGLAAVIVITVIGSTSNVAITVAATVGALAAFGLVYGLSWRSGLNSGRLVLVGIGTWVGTSAFTTLLIVHADPWSTPRIFTWMSGSTYDRSWEQVIPVLVALVVALPLALAHRRELDLLSIDDDTPRLVGIRLERVRLLALLLAAVLAATAVSAVGVVGFVGLIAPHAARALVSGRHAFALPVAVLLGAVLLSAADTLGRTVIAPAQIPAGLVVSIIGAPYFLFLLSPRGASRRG